MIRTLLILLLCVPAYSSDLFVGAFLHDAALDGNRIENGFDLGAEIAIGEKAIRPNAGITINPRFTSKAYAGLLYEKKISQFALRLAAGGAFQWNTIRALGSRFLFRIAIEIGWSRFSLILDHISNANLASSNAGLDIVGIRFKF